MATCRIDETYQIANITRKRRRILKWVCYRYSVLVEISAC
jgi:hypothetical protein